MKSIATFAVLGLTATCLIAPASAADSAPTELVAELQVFQRLVGKTFQGEFSNSTPEKPMRDVSRWERAMNGRAVRVLHSVNDGSYGGETIIMWDRQQKKISYWYFTTAGFFTTGTMEVDGQKWISLEKVTGNAQGITEVKATSELTAEGELVVKSQYQKDGKWAPGHEIRYKENPEGVVKFK